MSHITLGTNEYRGISTPIHFADSDRLRHMYMIGKTGVGKSTMFANMCLQDILNHHGVCFIDPHGESVQWLLEHIPQNRLEDVILFNPSDTENPIGLNLLEAKDEQEKMFLVGELIQIFYKLFDPDHTGIIGPQFEHWLRNAALTVMADPEGGTILEIPKLFVDKGFERYKRKFVTDQQVSEFWDLQMARTADFHRSEMLNYFSSKFGNFLSNPLMRNILGQAAGSLVFEDIIAEEKILLVDLSKGKIGELNSFCLGLIFISKLSAAILKRASIRAEERYPLYLYVDEFQNLTTDTFASMLSESRKYGLGVHLTNQYFAQLPANIQNAILGNAGTLLAFQIGTDDAERLEREFYPFSKHDLMNLDKYNFYLKLQIAGQTSEAFSGISLPPLAVEHAAQREDITLFNRLAYGHPRELVTESIVKRLK